MLPVPSLVTGKVEAWPIRPVSTVGDGRSDTRPVAGAVVEALQDGNVVAATTTDDDGRYELRVRPGSYVIRAMAERLHSKEPGKTVSIAAGQTLTVGFVLDTGIRCRWGYQSATCPLGVSCRRARQA